MKADKNTANITSRACQEIPNVVTTLKNPVVPQPPTWHARFLRRNTTSKQICAPKDSPPHQRARYYDNQSGEFLSRDPMEYVEGMSMYRAYFIPNKADSFGLKSIFTAVFQDDWRNKPRRPIVPPPYIASLHGAEYCGDCCENFNIELRCRTLAKPPVLFGFGVKHCFFVIEDCKGKRFTLSAFPLIPKKPYGPLKPGYDYGGDNTVMDDDRRAPRYPLQLSENIESWCAAARCLEAFANRPQNDYHPLDNNSNSFVENGIAECGLIGVLPTGAVTSTDELREHLIRLIMAQGATRAEAEALADQILNAGGF